MHPEWVSRDLVGVALRLEILGTGVERGLESIILRILRCIDVELALSLEHPGHGIRRAEVAAAARKPVPNLGDSPVGIVGHREDQDRDPSRTITLVCNLLVFDTFELARPLLDRPLDVFLRHRCCPRGLDRRSQPRITCGIATAELRGHRDLADELGEMSAALGVSRRLVMLDLLPFAVTSHSYPTFRD